MIMEPNHYEALLEIASRRKSVRHFAETPVPEQLIEKIVKIAHLSPYASGRKNWGIEVVKDQFIIKQAAQAVSDKVIKIKSNIPEDSQNDFTDYAENFTCFKNAPLLLIPYFRVSPTVSIMMRSPQGSLTEWERDSFVKSISCVAMMVLLASESLGLGACCVTGALIAEDELLPIFKIKPGRRIGALIPVGYKKTEAFS
jgi:nitroreductase